MLALIGHLATLYLTLLATAINATVLLILLGRSWGPIPFWYLQVVAWIQCRFAPQHAGASIVNKTHRRTQSAEDDSTGGDTNDIWSRGLTAANQALEAVVEDNVSLAFTPAPVVEDTLLRGRLGREVDPLRKALFLGTLLFRYLFLLPVRASLLLSSFVFIGIACVVAQLAELTDEQRTWIARVYCRLFCAGIGLVARFHDTQNRPQRPGIAVSNHLTPNDIQIIWTDVPAGAGYGYTNTGQKHTGIIGAIEKLVEQLCPSVWLERKSADERLAFMQRILSEGRQGGKGGPVLLFPEGFCTNNTRVLRFRKAVFEDNISIYPIAIRQSARFGDGFWCEDLFWQYMLRVFSSWAIVYDIHYLPPMRKLETESGEQFAARTQHAIGTKAGCVVADFDGSFWYRRDEQERIRLLKQAAQLARLQIEEDEKTAESNEVFISSSPVWEATPPEEEREQQAAFDMSHVVRRSTMVAAVAL